MFKSVKNFLHSYGQKNSFLKSTQDWRDVVFYAESSADWAHFENVIKKLNSAGQKVSYLCSDRNDPRLKMNNKSFQSFFVGNGFVLDILFRSINAKFFIMTLPDIETFHLKRSVHKVHYIYIFHSIVSTHMVYQKAAFDNYDTIFCVGEHHIEEIRKTEEFYKLEPKQIFKHGYGRLDNLLKFYKPTDLSDRKKLDSIVIAPSWGACSIAEDENFFKLVRNTLGMGIQVSVRLHPMTVRRFPELTKKLKLEFSKLPNFSIDNDMNNKYQLYDADLMITDWSGASYEFAFLKKSPVLFINTTMKVNNPEFKNIDSAPIEDFIRHQIGSVLEISDLDTVGDRLTELFDNRADYKKEIEKAMNKYVFNASNSGQAGADEIIRLLQNQRV